MEVIFCLRYICKACFVLVFLIEDNHSMFFSKFVFLFVIVRILNVIQYFLVIFFTVCNIVDSPLNFLALFFFQFLLLCKLLYFILFILLPLKTPLHCSLCLQLAFVSQLQISILNYFLTNFIGVQDP